MLNREPALFVALIQAILVLAVAFGVDLTGEQTAAVLAVVVAIGAVATRQTVYSPATVGDLVDAEVVIAEAENR
jgi:uncharacterized membrane protein